MFCNQCEQTAKSTGCTQIGVCGKPENVAALQDLLTHALQGLSIVAVAARKAGIVDAAVDRFTAEATFACLTNVDFDPARFETWIKKTVQLRNDLSTKLKAAGGTVDSDAAALAFIPAMDLAGMETQG
ncbi:MAG: hydroxylamine reductase, partial [Desulfobacterales bacterium]|nr:hydroxylamine reductase [Desulfobacterales bacterium]